MGINKIFCLGKLIQDNPERTRESRECVKQLSLAKWNDL